MPYPDSGPNCPIHLCPRTRNADQLMCGSHWRKVPHYLQRLVYKTWRERQDGIREGGERYRMAERAHEDAKRLAIGAVERLEADA